MKKLIYPCIIMMVFSFLSCEQEAIDTPDNNIADLQNSITNQNRTTDAEILENSLQWASFTIAEVLLKNTQLNSFFNNHINQNGTVSLRAILEDSSTNGVSFRNKFESYLAINFQQGIGNPEGQQGRPRLPIGGVGDNSPLISPSFEQQVDDYIDYLLVYNCVEIHLPYGFVFSRTVSYSTGHPLNNDNFNDGVKQTRGREFIVTENIDYLAPSMGMMHDNVFIARPVRTFSSNSTTCLYSDYSGIDFTTFFN